MRINIFKTSDEMGRDASAFIAAKLNEAIAAKGEARVLLSTGASQFEMFKYIVDAQVDWSKVTMFHLDEYVGLPESHIASFRKYLKERFVSKVNLKAAYFVNGEGDVAANIAELTAKLREAPIDVGVIGIGENAHIAFNDPPADFEDQRYYKVVNLSDTCIKQQLHEGWFKDENEAYKQAISMTCSKIMDCKTIISVVPYAVKAQAILGTLTREVTNEVPATLFKKHADVTVYCDKDSASLVDEETLKNYR